MSNRLSQLVAQFSVYEGEFWCLGTVNFEQNGPKLNSWPIYCLQLYGIWILSPKAEDFPSDYQKINSLGTKPPNSHICYSMMDHYPITKMTITSKFSNQSLKWDNIFSCLFASQKLLYSISLWFEWKMHYPFFLFNLVKTLRCITALTRM